MPAKEQPKLAFIGVRPCELAAIGIQDRVFIRDDFVDPIYYNRRVNVLTIVVNCLHPSRTCFCTSMQTGPKAEMGFDLSLTELEEVFLVDIGSDAGLALMQPLNWEPASAYDLQIEEDEFISSLHREEALLREDLDAYMERFEQIFWKMQVLEIPDEFAVLDNDEDGYISFDELLHVIEDYFDFEIDLTIDELRQLNEFFFSQ